MQMHKTSVTSAEAELANAIKYAPKRKGGPQYKVDSSFLSDWTITCAFIFDLHYFIFIFISPFFRVLQRRTQILLCSWPSQMKTDFVSLLLSFQC